MDITNKIIIINDSVYSINKIAEYCDQFLDCRWEIVDIINKENYLSNKKLDAGIQKVQASYYSIFSVGFAVPDDFLQNIDIAYNDRLDRFILLLPFNNQGLTVQTNLYRSNILDGNTPNELGKNIAEKLINSCKEQDSEYLVKKIEEICSSIAD